MSGPPGRSRPSAIACGALAAVLVLGWQFLTVRSNYGGHWTALFCTGARLPQPPGLACGAIYTFANSHGYDGQFYHYIAHDPFFQQGFSEYIDAPALRCRRLLVPCLAWLLAAGRPRRIDAAYVAVVAGFVFLGSWWLARYALLGSAHAAWGLAFLLVPATLVSMDRLTVDVALAALTVAFVFYSRPGPSWKLYPVLALAPLARETGLLLIGGTVSGPRRGDSGSGPPSARPPRCRPWPGTAS